jgi:Ser/Thr protein kinase RdoA (MazF antagonist)
LLDPDSSYGHGMGLAPESKDWQHLQANDLLQLQAHYPCLQGVLDLSWHSPRPFSSAAIVLAEQGEFFIKRSHGSFRTVVDLLQEHAFIQHLAQQGIAVVTVYANRQGVTATALGDWVYEVFARAQGEDVYVEQHSWKPFFYPQHAYAAGQLLARLHAAAADFPAAARQTPYLISNQNIIEAVQPQQALEQRIASSTVLRSYFAKRPLPEQFWQCLLDFQRPIQAALSQSPKIWTHNDLHGSNLIWSDATAQAHIVAVIDFGLSDLCTAAYDFAVSLERNFIDWLALADDQQALAIDDAGLTQFIHAYLSHSPVFERAQLAVQLLPLAHIDFALYELEYFLAISHNLSHADAAYDYLVEHLLWFVGQPGQQLLAKMRQKIAAAAAQQD